MITSKICTFCPVRLIKKRSFNLLCVLDLFSERRKKMQGNKNSYHICSKMSAHKLLAVIVHTLSWCFEPSQPLGIIPGLIGHTPAMIPVVFMHTYMH